ncbi:hypothetical protein ACFWII_38210 [Streptomyces sp. NPDC127063]|uniref:hypothetical protein n=1 Tax=Streptomyces sp. NPDC127063 TaxID=3347123 RepID=UPI00364E6C40
MIALSSIDLTQFIVTWYGQPDRSDSRATDCDQLPEPLRAWHELAERYSFPLLGNKRFTPPNEIKAHDGKMVFLTDQSDAIWGYDPGDEMSVYEGRIYGDWVKLTESLSEFLVHNALGEAAYNAPFTRTCDSVPNHRMADILTPMTEVSVGAWKWPAENHRIFLGSNIVAEVGPGLTDGSTLDDNSGCSEVQIGSTHASALAYLDQIPDLDWF